MELSEVKRAIILQTVVRYDGMSYTVSGCTLKFNRKNGEWYYLLELKDLKANSVTVVPMQYVAVLGGDAV